MSRWPPVLRCASKRLTITILYLLREHMWMFHGYATLSGLRRGPESCGSRSRGSGRSSNRSLTRSEIKEALRGATSELVGDLTQEIRAKLEPLIPPQSSPTMAGISTLQVQANHLVVGLTTTLGSLRSPPMPTPAVIPRSPFIPRTAQPPYSHVENPTRAERDRLGLTTLRAMVDVEPYGSSDLGGDPSDDEPPSMTSASSSEDDGPEDPENPSGRKKKRTRKTKRPEGRRSQEAKAIATSKIVVNLPEFTGKDLSEFAVNFCRFLRMTGQTHASGRVRCDLLLQCCKTKYLEKQVKPVFPIICPLLTKILPTAEERPHKSEHRDQKYVKSCRSPSAIVYCYQNLCLGQKWDKMHRRREPKKFGTIPINWFKLVFKITGCADCFEKNLRLLLITGFSD